MTVWCVSVLECVRAPTAKRLLLQLLVLIRIHGCSIQCYSTAQPNLHSPSSSSWVNPIISRSLLLLFPLLRTTFTATLRSGRMLGKIEQASAKMEYFFSVGNAMKS